MRKIPIYQMSYGQNEQGNFGLMFSDELKDYTPSVIYTIPFTERIHPYPFHFDDITYYFRQNTFVFPFLNNKKLYLLEGKFYFPELIFNSPNFDFPISFEIGLNDLYKYPYMDFNKIKSPYNKYIGSNNRILNGNDYFLILKPVDLFEMDEVYIETKGVFVGLTPSIYEYYVDEFNDIFLRG